MNIPDFSMTTLEAAMANTEAAVKVQVAQFNQQRISGFMTTFHNWSLSVEVGRSPNTYPPQPPNAMVVGHFTDPTNTKALWAYPAEGTEPVCKMPPIPKVTPPPAPLAEPDNIRNVPKGDVLPVGFTFTAPDGSKWQKQSSHTPFGIAYFYLKVG